MAQSRIAPTVSTERTRLMLAICGIACLVATVALLALTADTTPTTPQTRRLFGLWRVRQFVPALVLVVVGLGCLIAARSRARLLGYLASWIAVLGTLGVLEGLGAVGAVSWRDVFKSDGDHLGRLGAVLMPHIDKSGVTYQDTAKAWGLPAEPVPFRFRADRYGFRNDADRVSADVILLGDSMIVAALVPSDRTISAVLEQITGRSTMQAALIGIAPQEAHSLLEKARVPLKGAHVIQFIFEGNDLLDSRNYRAKVGTTPRPRETGSLMLNEIWLLLTRVTDNRMAPPRQRLCTIDGQLYTFLWDRSSFAGLEDEMSAITKSLEEFAARIRAQGARYSVVFVPDKLRVLAKRCTFAEGGEIKDPAEHIGPMREDLLDWGQKSGIDVLDLTPALVRAADEGRIPWFWGDTHWNEAGHRAAAEALAEWLGQRGQLRSVAPDTSGAGPSR